MPRASGEGDERVPDRITAGAGSGGFRLGRWGGRLTICAFMVSAGVVAGVAVHSWGPEFARSPYYSLPYSSATAPPVVDVRPLPDVVPVPLAQQPSPQAAPSNDTTPAQPPSTAASATGGSGARHAGQAAPVNRPAQLIGVSPGSVAFDPQPVGTSAAARTVTVANTGSQPLRVRQVGLSGGDVTAFAVVADHCSGVTLNPGSPCPVSVSFTPDADGNRSATLTAAGDGAPPATTTLKGTATDAPLTATGLPVDCGQSTATRCVVAAIYQHLLARPVDDAALQSYSSQLDAGQTTRQQLATAVQSGDEWRTRLVGILFKQLLGRPADPGALGYYVPQLRSGSVEDVTSAIAGSQEYFARAGGSNDTFVSAVYHDFLRRSPDAPGKAAWVDQLNRGASRTAVASSIRRSAEAQSVVADAAYRLLLGRQATSAERTNLGNAMVHGLSFQAMQASLIQTDEYFAQAAPLTLTDAAVATFVDGDPKGNPSQFTATVDWGDGTPPTAATVTKGKNGFVVVGSHTYGAHRSWTATIHVTDVGGSQAQTTATIVV